MGRYLTAHGFTNSPALLGEVSAHRHRRRTPCAGRRPGLHPQPGRRLDLDPEPVQPRLRRPRRPTRPRPKRAPTTSRTTTTFAATIGRQLAAMHGVLAQPTDDEAFAPRSRDREDVEAWIERAPGGCCRKAFDIIASAQDWENEADDTATPRSLLANASADRAPLRRPGRDRRRRHADDAHPWRLPSRPGAGGERRCLHHRLRGRAGAAAGRAPRQDEPAARRRRTAALARLRRRRRRSIPRTLTAAPLSPRTRARLAHAPARRRAGGVPRRLPRRRRAIAGHCDKRWTCSISS